MSMSLKCTNQLSIKVVIKSFEFIQGTKHLAPFMTIVNPEQDHGRHVPLSIDQSVDNLVRLSISDRTEHTTMKAFPFILHLEENMFSQPIGHISSRLRCVSKP